MMTKTSDVPALIRCGGNRRINLSKICSLYWYEWSLDPQHPYQVEVMYENDMEESYFLSQQDFESFIHEVNLYCPSIIY